MAENSSPKAPWRVTRAKFIHGVLNPHTNTANCMELGEDGKTIRLEFDAALRVLRLIAMRPKPPEKEGGELTYVDHDGRPPVMVPLENVSSMR